MDQNQDEPKSLLTNLRSYHIVEVKNPLSKDFTWPIARSVVEVDPRYVDQTMQQMKMRNPDHPTQKHVQSFVTIPAGATYRLPGDVAQVVVKHLVDEIIYQSGEKQTVGDPSRRRAVEESIITNTNDLRERLARPTGDQLANQLADLNAEQPEKKQDEQPFPAATGHHESGATDTKPAGRGRTARTPQPQL